MQKKEGQKTTQGPEKTKKQTKPWFIKNSDFEVN